MRPLAAVLLLALTACSAPTPPPGPAPKSAPASTPAPAATSASPGGKATRGQVRFREIGRFERPVAFAVRKGDKRLYVAEQGGRLRTTGDGSNNGANTGSNGRAGGDVVVDLSREVSGGNEQGLLGVAFHPSGRWLYLDWTDAGGTTHVTEWAYDGHRATGRRDVLTQEQPYANHNGGQLAFGPDGHLYVGLGDGGSAGDPQGNGQDLGTLLGKILRIDPRGKPYEVPRDNPFVGERGARTEIWAYGLRNPWRFGFDRESGDLWIGDVGQDEQEEVDHQPAASGGGENYGWNLREGERPFRGGKGRGLTDPVITYPLHKDGNCSVIAGYVYRGAELPWLRGSFLYGDFCAGWVRAVPAAGPGKRGRAAEPGKADELGTVEQLSSFGEGLDGELYALSLRGPLYRIEPA
ncbi:PQQ-dependent sugar dehydrogenase [Nonomuraea spiralis]|uniref:PQQ-dependent sugar dehydrogenase n=1 Tax=Nonomuraea spiralis TaxID=46182 RepID=A0ABV5IGA3_9ACTN|nr:PQQ-dependent sugar dehydrogenase [Nonomuraea spiralis]